MAGAGLDSTTEASGGRVAASKAGSGPRARVTGRAARSSAERSGAASRVRARRASWALRDSSDSDADMVVASVRASYTPSDLHPMSPHSENNKIGEKTRKSKEVSKNASTNLKLGVGRHSANCGTSRIGDR
jgi:hypothetical protein